MKDQKLRLKENETATPHKGKEQRSRKAKLVQPKMKYKHARHWLEEEEDDDDERYIPFYLKEEEE